MLSRAFLAKLAVKSWTAYRFINHDVQVSLPGGDTMFVPVFNRMGRENLAPHVWDFGLIEVLRPILRMNHGGIIDVGANVGR